MVSAPHRVPDVITLQNDRLALEVVPALGASVRSFTAASGRAIWRAPGDAPPGPPWACFLLVPYSNRVRNGCLHFGDRTYALPPGADGHALHGPARHWRWQVTSHSERHLSCAVDSRDHGKVGEAAWPWAFGARVDYRLCGPCLEVTLSVRNLDRTAMPAGLGLHPFFQRRQDGADVQLAFGAQVTCPVGTDLLPDGPARPLRADEDFSAGRGIGTQHLDRVYAEWHGAGRGAAFLSWETPRRTIQSLAMRADPLFSHLVVFTAPDGSLALEPVSHATDAFNLAARGVTGTGARTLAPGEALTGAVSFTLGGKW